MGTENSVAGKEKEEESQYRLLYCICNPAWVKFLWFRRNFILGREKKASCFQKNECFNLFTWLDSRRDEGCRISFRSLGSSQQKCGAGWDTVPLRSSQAGAAPSLLSAKACHVAGSASPSTSCFNSREFSRALSSSQADPAILWIMCMQSVLWWPLLSVNIKPRGEGWAFRSRVGSENRHTPGSNCSAQEKWNLPILVYWWFTPGCLPKRIWGDLQ